MTAEEALTVVQGIEKAVKSEGCSDVSELIERLHGVQANALQAEKARDAFAEEVKDMKKNLGSKGGELGFLKQKVKELEEELEQAKASAPEHTAASDEPTKVTSEPPPPSKSVEEQVAEIEATLTDEQWDAADQLLNAYVQEQDPTKKAEAEILARKLALPTRERLELLRDLAKDVEVMPVPTTLRPKKADTATPPKDEGSLYERLKAQAVGPMGGVLRARSGVESDQRAVHKAFR